MGFRPRAYDHDCADQNKQTCEDVTRIDKDKLRCPRQVIQGACVREGHCAHEERWRDGLNSPGDKTEDATDGGNQESGYL